jgi:putative flippase GtrA
MTASPIIQSPIKGSPSGLVRWLKFNAVGAIGIAVQLSVLTLLKSGLGLNYLLATALAVEATVLHNFIWHERFTWSDRLTTSRYKRLLKFNLATGAFSIAGNMFFTKLLVDAGMNYLSANSMSIALCSIVNFFLNDRLVFVVSPRRGGSFRMTQRWIVLLSALLFSCGLSRECRAQNPVIEACAAFAWDGALATGTLRDGDLETKMEQRAVVVTIQDGRAWRGCRRTRTAIGEARLYC